MPLPLIVWIGLGAIAYIASQESSSKQPAAPSDDLSGTDEGGESGTPGESGSDGESSGESGSVVAGEIDSQATEGEAISDPSESGPEIIDPEINQGGEVARSASFESFQSAYARSPYFSAVQSAEESSGLPENLLARLIYAESSFNPNATNLNKNGTTDQGICQINSQYTPAGIDPFNAEASIAWAAKYLASLYAQTNDWRSALVAYNWGIGNVKKLGVDRAPAATLAYADGILSDSEALA